MAKILLIEDDPLVVKMYRNVLSFEGFQIETAPNGTEGLKKAKEFVPDLIFLDIMMPKMNGIEVLENIKKDPDLEKIPVIMLTNLAGADNAEEALKKGAFAYMVKSEYKPKEVAQKAKEFFDKKGIKVTNSFGGSQVDPMKSSESEKEAETVTSPTGSDEVKIDPPEDTSIGSTKLTDNPTLSSRTDEGNTSSSSVKTPSIDPSKSTLPSPANLAQDEASTPSSDVGIKTMDTKTQPGGAVQSPPPPTPGKTGSKMDSKVTETSPIKDTPATGGDMDTSPSISPGSPPVSTGSVSDTPVVKPTPTQKTPVSDSMSTNLGPPKDNNLTPTASVSSSSPAVSESSMSNSSAKTSDKKA